MFKWLKKSSTQSESETLREKTTHSSIVSTYKKIEKEIDSLRKYDRGEKTITPGNLKDIVRSI